MSRTERVPQRPRRGVCAIFQYLHEGKGLVFHLLRRQDAVVNEEFQAPVEYFQGRVDALAFVVGRPVWISWPHPREGAAIQFFYQAQREHEVQQFLLGFVRAQGARFERLSQLAAKIFQQPFGLRIGRNGWGRVSLAHQHRDFVPGTQTGGGLFEQGRRFVSGQFPVFHLLGEIFAQCPQLFLQGVGPRLGLGQDDHVDGTAVRVEFHAGRGPALFGLCIGYFAVFDQPLQLLAQVQQFLLFWS